MIDIAQEFASYFVPKNGLIVSEVEGKSGNRKNFVSRGYDVIKNVKDKKIIILVDKNSASASGIFAAALRENNLATLIGEKTFGKGSVQNMVDINDHITLKVTIARWYTPKGATIDGVGVMPDIIVPQGTSMVDLVMERAVQYLIEGK